MERVLIDTNVMVIGARDYAEDKDTPGSIILKLALKNKIKVIMNPTLLKEYHRVAVDLEGKDLAGWFRNVIMKDLSISYVDETAIKRLMERYDGEVPSEDLPHFASCLLGGVDFLISVNRDFLKKTSKFNFRCVKPKEYLKESDAL
ncbi:hypothetical protein AKJ47_02230 [candidate division MSBL1 archaeon SCGC-AAA261G05]|uniref:PIN domain-containing protein n=2 Tax=candidate division MSBL1 TaxID=215777 RepID=A0A133VAI1_9EURY|nr:hypothetical protein AKJ47_02230 [candidate division MSBL1 archaeon SCGC-AAA261G05]KXB04778.1 hypothetical protein AKJ48_01420 [candidate division MSBL1 archaeon SCGC-AAA261O19]